MLKHGSLEHRFVEDLPDDLRPGVLYVSMEYGTAAHRCCCGCGEEIVTPFTPTDWKMTYDGESVSLRPSVGNWMLPCRSHYVIERGRVVEAGSWSDEQVEAERRRDHAAKARHYGVAPTAKGLPRPPVASRPAPPAGPGLMRRVWNALTGRR